MSTFAKKILPKLIQKPLYALKHRTFDRWYKRHLAKKMVVKHQELLAQIRGKERIKVVYLVIFNSAWKVDAVFKKMLADPFFEPLILIIPYTIYGDERMWLDMKDAYDYFQEKGYPLISSYHEQEKRWITLEEIQPDIVFFTNPHNLTRKEYYEDAYLNYLSCYVPYHHEVGSYGTPDSQHNQVFHNAMWKIFAAHEKSYEVSKKVADNKGVNVTVTGYPAMENLQNIIALESGQKNENRLKIIWAPHHIISEEINQSNFLEFADFFQKIAIKNKEKIFWIFKPHPILKSKLYNHPLWGKEKTDNYYSFWENNEFSQLQLGDYERAFQSSDAMIHDCGSFLVEYLYTQKPVLYLLNEKHYGQFFNSFGQEALASCRIAKTKAEINNFIDNLINRNIGITDNQKIFYENNIKKYFVKSLPSEQIVRAICLGIK